jgi:nitrate/TMAO reductase-like tetraheme cytochrome c subunit
MREGVPVCTSSHRGRIRESSSIFDQRIAHGSIEKLPVNSPQPAHRGFGAWLWQRPQRWFLLGIPVGGLIAFLLGIAFTGGFLGSLKLAETDKFCTSCHEMNTPFQELAGSVHYSNVFGIQASCGNCHVPPKFIPGLWRHIQAYAEVWGHMKGELDTPAKYEAHRLQLAQKIWKELKANDSAECRGCHTPAAMAFSKQPVEAASAHQSLAKDGMTCIDCHRGVAHTLPRGG